MVTCFLILRRRYHRIYVPRTYVGVLKPWQRSPPSPMGLWNWITEMYKLPDTYVLQHHSMDAYLLIRFLKLISGICFVGCCMTWPILWPVDATADGGGKQFEKITITNIVPNPARYLAHNFVTWIFVGELHP